MRKRRVDVEVKGKAWLVDERHIGVQRQRCPLWRTRCEVNNGVRLSVMRGEKRDGPLAWLSLNGPDRPVRIYVHTHLDVPTSQTRPYNRENNFVLEHHRFYRRRRNFG